MKKFFKMLEKRLGASYVVLILSALSIFLFAIGYPILRPTNQKITLNAIAQQTLRATRTVEDKEATQRAQETAANNVQNVYEKSEEAANNKLAEVTRFFEVMSAYRRELAQDSTDSSRSTTSRINEIVSRFFTSLSGDNANIQNYAVVFSDNSIRSLLSASESEYATYESVTKQVLTRILSEEIYENATDLNNYRNQAKGLIVAGIYTDAGRALVNELVDSGIVPTMLVNQEATAAAKEAAKAGVSPTMITQGEVLVREGEAIVSSVYRKLQLLGMTSDTYNYQSLIGYVAVLALQLILVSWFIFSQAQGSKRYLYVNLYAFFIFIMSIITISADLVQTAGASYFGLIVPLGILPLLMIPKAKRRLAILAITFLIIIYFFLGESGDAVQVPLVWRFYALMGMFSTIIVSGSKQRRLKSHLFMMLLINLSLVTILSLFQGIDLISSTFSMMLLYVVLNVLVTIALTRLGRPYFDLLFEDRAVLKMMELSNPNQPLLKELIQKAPGTYHHSVMVANLSANAVELIGGDSLFTRVACYYHDVGKLKDPIFFVENLPAGMENPHKLLTPEESRDIIFEHVSHGIELLTKADMPQDIIDICAQHHGTSIVKYFYSMAKEADETVTEEMFRYPGPTPTTKESAVISIADTVEAAARSMKAPNLESLTQLVKDTVRSRIEDGQFDQCPISIQELKVVEDSLIRGLAGSYHTRVEYPKLKKNK